MSDFQERIKKKTEKILSNNNKLSDLLQDVTKRINSGTIGDSSLLDKLTTLVNMVKDHYSGKYTSFSNSSIFLFVFGLVYFLTPVDLVPDFLPGLGLVDDMSLLYWIFKNLGKDIERYEEWRSAKEVS